MERLAERIARQAHADQVDAGGTPFIEHPAAVAGRVAARGGTDAQIAAAWLHDVVEDTNWTADDLLAATVPPEVVEIVLVVSRRDDETYAEFIDRVTLHEAAALVKDCDLEVNLARNPHGIDPQRLNRLRARYRRAREVLAPQLAEWSLAA